MGNLSIRCGIRNTGSRSCACPQRSSASMSFSWLFLGWLVSTRARFRFTNREQHAVNWLCRSSILQRTANYLLTVCLTPGGKPTVRLYDSRRTKAAVVVRAGAVRIVVFKLTTQPDSHNSICFGGKCSRAYLRRNDRANWFANRESSSVLIIKHVSKDNDGSDSGLITTPSALRPTEAGSVTIATPTC